MPLAKKEIRRLRTQKFFSRFVIFFMGGLIILLVKSIRGYKIKNLKEVRKHYLELARGNYPILICANHLTMIDSVILHWALAPIYWYPFHFRKFSWNLPAVENFKTNFLYRTITYLSKCIAIDRQGGSEHTDAVLSKIRYLLQKGELFTIFPEGTRSRSGRIDVDSVTYGVGKILENLTEARVLCIYLRGHNQQEYSYFPAKKAEFDLRLTLIHPTTEQKGRRRQRALALAVINELKRLEDEYFFRNDSTSI